MLSFTFGNGGNISSSALLPFFLELDFRIHGWYSDIGNPSAFCQSNRQSLRLSISIALRYVPPSVLQLPCLSKIYSSFKYFSTDYHKKHSRVHMQGPRFVLWHSWKYVIKWHRTFWGWRARGLGLPGTTEADHSLGQEDFFPGDRGWASSQLESHLSPSWKPREASFFINLSDRPRVQAKATIPFLACLPPQRKGEQSEIFYERISFSPRAKAWSNGEMN